MKKGFTLVELLAVLAILAIISLITIPLIQEAINSSRDSSLNQQKKEIEKAAMRYIADNSTNSSMPNCLNVSDLQKKGYLKNNLKNPKIHKLMGGSVKIEFNKYSYDSEPCKTNLDKIKNLVVTSGDGLYADTYETGRYIYRGANPNNYITLGSDKYRIISIEKDNTLKVIKNGSIGSKVFDTSNARYSTTDTDYCNSIISCKVWGSKTTMLNSSGNNVTTMPREIGGTEYNLPDKEASLNTYLNNDWYNSLDSNVKNKITTHMFNVGLVSYRETDLATTLSTESAYKWKGKVGLMNVSDYIKASTNSACTSVYSHYGNSSCYNNSSTHNWILSSLGSTNSWTMAPYSYSFAYYVFYVHGSSRLGNYSASYSFGAAPVLYLSSDINITGEGTEDNPYKVTIS